MRIALTPREKAAIDAARLAASNPMTTWHSLGQSNGLLFDADQQKLCFRRGSRDADFNTPRNYRVEIWRWQWLHYALTKIKANKQRGDRRHGGLVTHAQEKALRALLSFVDPKRPGIIDPSYAAIAARGKIARSTAQLAVGHALVMGLLKKVRRYQRWDTGHGIVAVQDTNAYELVIPKDLKHLLHGTERRSEVALPVLNNKKEQAPCQDFIHSDLGKALSGLQNALKQRSSPCLE